MFNYYEDTFDYPEKLIGLLSAQPAYQQASPAATPAPAQSVFSPPSTMQNGKAYYGNDGTLYIWTGTGYQPIPKIAQGDLAFNTGRFEESGGVGDSAGAPIWMGPDVGLSSDKYGVGNFSGVSNNWQTSWDGTNKNAFDLLLKSADKEGSQIRYELKDGQYVPTLTGTTPWDTNNSFQNLALLRMAAIGLSMGTLGPMLEAAGAASGAGTSAASMAAQDAAGLAAQGLSAQQIASTLATTGIDSFVAADIAQLAAQGLSASAIAQNAVAAYGSSLSIPGAASGLLSTTVPFENNFPPGGPDLTNTPPLDLPPAPPPLDTPPPPFENNFPPSGPDLPNTPPAAPPPPLDTPPPPFENNFPPGGPDLSGAPPLDLPPPAVPPIDGGPPPFENNFPPGGPDLSGTPPLDLPSLPNWLNPNLAKLIATLGGGLIGKISGGNDGGSSSPPGPTGGPVTAPKMYGGASSSPSIPTFPMYGNTDTERYMTQSYLPSLFQKTPSATATSGIGLGPMRALAGSGFEFPAGSQGLIGMAPGARQPSQQVNDASVSFESLPQQDQLAITSGGNQVMQDMKNRMFRPYWMA